MSYVKTVYWSILLLTFYDAGAQLLHFCETNGKDPCKVANETVPFEPEARYVNCGQPSGPSYCDRYIVPGWYRYSERMWNQCPSLARCGAVYPYWLNGTHPTEVNTEVQRSVCKVGFASCCERQVTIKIRNCGQFMAYCLPALDSCPERYCFDGPSSSTTVIVMGAVIGILLISIIVFGSVVVFRKRNKGTDGNTYEEPFTTLQENTYETSANVYTNEERGYEQLPVDHNTKSGYSVQSDDPYDSIDDRIRSGLSREEEINLEEK
ncbi:uncharacterized protein [Magallana gigas]|uniref:uncharacterized protein isoform X5 n=1 Tax=Magallana gigas TaxID=29159 RepID=UPI003340A909